MLKVRGLARLAVAVAGIGALTAAVVLAFRVTRPTVPLLPGVILSPASRAAPIARSIAVRVAERVHPPPVEASVFARHYLIRALTLNALPDDVEPPGYVTGGALDWPATADRADPQLQHLLTPTDALNTPSPSTPPVWVVFYRTRGGAATVVLVDATTGIALATLVNVRLSFVHQPSETVKTCDERKSSCP